MRFLLLFHLALGAASVAAVYGILGPFQGFSILAGAAVSFGNLLVLALAWPRILAKKLVALSIGVIVFKFAILAWILNVVATDSRFHLGWFAVGLALVVVSVLAAAYRDSLSSNDRSDETGEIAEKRR